MSRPVVTSHPVGSGTAEDVEAAVAVSRRSLMASALIAGATVVAAPALGRAVQAATADVPSDTGRLDGAPYTGRVDEPLVARVVDVRTGEIDVFFGEEHVVLHDRTVAARLARAVR